VEEVSQGPGGETPRNWRGYYGSIRLDALQPHCIIDRCAAERGSVSLRTYGGGERSFGLRPLRPDPGILDSRANFFHGLRASISEVGIKLPILVWALNEKVYVRYGASRVHVAKSLGIDRAPAILCQFNGDGAPSGFITVRALSSPASVLEALGPLSSVGHFIVDHEMIDIHRAEPYGFDPMP